MTIIKADCTTCGTVDLTAGDVTVELGAATEGVADTFRFTCPNCGETRRRPAGERARSLLLAAGAHRETRITESEIGTFRRRLGGLDTAGIIRHMIQD